MAKITEEAVNVAKDIYEHILNDITKFLSNNKEFLTGMGVGAALATPAGVALIKRLGKDAAKLVSMSKQYGKKAITDAVKYVVDSKVGKYNAFESAKEEGTWTNKVAKSSAAVGAAIVAGKMVGSWLGNTITEDNDTVKFFRVAFPAVFSTYDWAKEGIATLQTKHDQKKESQSAVKEVLKQVEMRGSNATVDKEESGKQVVEYEKNKKGSQTPLKTTSDKLVEYMNKKSKIFNHPDWYAKFPEFITSNLNWGIRKEYHHFNTVIGAQVPVALVIPQKNGAVSRSYQDMIHAAFAKLRGSNSGAFNYVAEDVAAYIEITRGIRALHANLVRDIKLYNNIDPYIAKTPAPILKCAGYDEPTLDNTRNLRAQHVATLNQLAEVIDQTFPCFPDMAVYDRSIYLAKAILEEGKGPKSSVFVYQIAHIMTVVPSGNDKNTIQDTFCGQTDFESRLAVLINAISAARNFVSAVYPNADTFSKIAGDMFKAYGQRALARTCDRVTLNDKATVVFDEYLLNQLQNSTTASTFQTVTQATPLSAFNVSYTTRINVSGTTGVTTTYKTIDLPGMRTVNDEVKPVVVTTHKSTVSGAEAVSLTRGIAVARYSSVDLSFNSPLSPIILHCDADVILSLSIILYDSNNAISSFYLQPMTFQQAGGVPEELWAQLDYCPTITLFNEAVNGGLPRIMLDVDNYTFMTESQILQFNDTVVLSLYKTVDISDQVNFRSVKR